jgi:hypothetical protein
MFSAIFGNITGSAEPRLRALESKLATAMAISNNGGNIKHNHCMQRTAKSGAAFAAAKDVPLLAAADANR